ncbi:MAG: hypothetical protein OXM87_06360 [Truepera sp.]|nr:hypothetical protein [Truepera sp.]
MKVAKLRFIVVTSLFMAAFLVLTLLHVRSLLLWTGFIALWTLAEYVVAREIHLKWWQWGLLLAGLAIVDVTILSLT